MMYQEMDIKKGCEGDRVEEETLKGKDKECDIDGLSTLLTAAFF